MVDPLKGLEAAAADLSNQRRKETEVVAGEGPPSADTFPEEAEHLTDLGNARRLIRRHGKNLLYCHGWQKWLVWDGRRYQIDDTEQITRYAKDTSRGIYGEAEQAEDGERRRLAAWAVKSESDSKIRAMIKLTRSEPEVIVMPDQLDADPWALNVENGVIDLRTGKIRDHRRADRITKFSPIAYDREAKCHRFEAFIYEIMNGKEDLIAFLRRAVGYSLTGDTREQVLFLAHGFGANGKSTFIEAIRNLLGEYCKQADFSTFLKKDRDEIRNDIAALAGARFVSAIEAESGRRLSEVLVKQLTGGDAVRARFLYREAFEFRPTAKFWLAANHKPVIRGGDHAIWRRIRLIPFTVTISEKKQDKTLPEKLRAEAPGILAWAVRGCLEWQARGLDAPPEVLAATEEYRSEMDAIGEFISDCCVLSPEVRATVGDLYRQYTAWAEKSGEKNIMSKRTFGQALAERGFESVRTNEARFWKGIGVTQVTQERIFP